MEMKSALGRRAGRLAALLCAGGLLGACQTDYLDRRDSIALGAGDAMAHNRVVHTVDPWPPHVGDTRLPGDGDRMRLAVERYKANKTVKPRGLAGGRPAAAAAASAAGADADQSR